MKYRPENIKPEDLLMLCNFTNRDINRGWKKDRLQMIKEGKIKKFFGKIIRLHAIIREGVIDLHADYTEKRGFYSGRKHEYSRTHFLVSQQIKEFEQLDKQAVDKV